MSFGLPRPLRTPFEQKVALPASKIEPDVVSLTLHALFFFFCPAETQDTLPTVGSRPRPACEFACTALVAARGPRELLPGHGPPVTTPTWTADLNSRCRRGFQFQQPPNLQAGGGPPRVTPTWPLGGGAAGQHPPALRGICTPPLF